MSYILYKLYDYIDSPSPAALECGIAVGRPILGRSVVRMRSMLRCIYPARSHRGVSILTRQELRP